jgi:hypothetical protein
MPSTRCLEERLCPDSCRDRAGGSFYPASNHDHEFIELMLSASRQLCSGSFDFAGPLTRSELIGNIAAHCPGGTLAFGARELAFQKQPAANQYLTREYRHGWRVKA